MKMIEPKDLPPDLPVIDLAVGPNADWRDILRKNPNDPRFQGPPLTVKLTDGIPDMAKYLRTRKTVKKKK